MTIQPFWKAWIATLHIKKISLVSSMLLKNPPSYYKFLFSQSTMIFSSNPSSQTNISAPGGPSIFFRSWKHFSSDQSLTFYKTQESHLSNNLFLLLEDNNSLDMLSGILDYFKYIHVCKSIHTFSYAHMHWNLHLSVPHHGKISCTINLLF